MKNPIFAEAEKLLEDRNYCQVLQIREDLYSGSSAEMRKYLNQRLAEIPKYWFKLRQRIEGDLSRLDRIDKYEKLSVDFNALRVGA